MGQWEYVCEACGRREGLDAPVWRCSACGSALRLAGGERLTPEAIEQGERSLWRYAQLLPVPRAYAASLGEGLTPLVQGTLGGQPVWFKCDNLLPTGSFKDRGAALLTAHLRRLGLRHLIVDSSGNAAAAMAGYSAAAGLDCTVYVPAQASPGKLVQARAFGATVIPVEGSREEVARAAQVAADADPTAFYASHNWHPIFVEGVKTWALEVWEQLGRRAPAVAYTPTGGGSALVGGRRGFAALTGVTTALVAAQPAACAPVVQAFATQGELTAIEAGPTIAEGTHIAAPARRRQLLDALYDSGGWAVAVGEEEIVAALRELWAQGLYVEPTGAVGAAAYRADLASGRSLPEGDIVVLLTGSGLKATETIAALLA